MLLSLFAAGFLLALPACGGGTSSKSSHETSASAKKTAPKATTTASAKASPTPTAPGSTSRTQTTGTPSSTVKAGLPVSECRRLNVLAAKMGQAFTGSTPAADTKAYADYLQLLAKSAPTEIRGDFGVLADAYAKIAVAVTAVYPKPGATPSADQLKKLSDVGKELNGGEIKRAADKINSWLQTGCAR